tara:strand:+ start:1075 stop:1365 length:291 start_codon:yes stop_codon:yes gene_type:complete
VERWEVVMGGIVITHAGVVFVHIFVVCATGSRGLAYGRPVLMSVFLHDYHHSGWIMVRMFMLIAVHTFAEWKMLRMRSCSSGCGELEVVSVLTVMY